MPVIFFSTSKFFPFEMSMTTSDIKIRIDLSHSLSVSRLQTLVLRWLEVFVATGTRVRGRGSLGPLEERIYF